MMPRTTLQFRKVFSYCFSALLSAVYFIVFPANASDSCPEGLIAYWRLGDTSAPYSDQIGSLAGTCTACPSAGTSGAVADNGAQSFNGSNDNISVAAGTSFNWSVSDSFSIELWIKSSASGDDEVLIAREDSTNQTLWELVILANGRARFTLRASNGDSKSATGAKVLNNNLWHHIAAVRERGTTDQIRLYADGELESQVTHTYSAGFASDADLTIGCDDGGSEPFDGLIDEIGIYDSALSEIDIRSHYFLSRQYCGLMESTVRIMPLGDSITDDNQIDKGTSGDSYRKPLWKVLNSNNFRVNFVGSRHNQTTDFDNDHEGHPGYRSDEIASYVQGYLTNNPADIILLHIGTNGLTSSSDDVENILDNIDSFDSGRGQRITIVLARIIDWVPNNSTVHQFNDNVEAMAEARITSGDKIIMVDMEDGAGLDYAIYPCGDFVDHLHPHDIGYVKMSDVWYGALDAFMPMVEPPVITSSPIEVASNGILYSYQVVATGDPAPAFDLTTCPDGMTIGATSGLIRWTPDALGDEDVVVRVHNTDADWGSTTQRFSITVTENNMPQITSTAPGSATVDSVFTYTATATDADGDTLTWSLASGPSGMRMDAATGVVTWTPAEGDIETVNCSIIVSDGRGGRATQNFTITISSQGDGGGESGGSECFVQTLL
jgi:hypothetical protein